MKTSSFPILLDNLVKKIQLTSLAWLASRFFFCPQSYIHRILWTVLMETSFHFLQEKYMTGNVLPLQTVGNFWTGACNLLDYLQILKIYTNLTISHKPATRSGCLGNKAVEMSPLQKQLPGIYFPSFFFKEILAKNPLSTSPWSNDGKQGKLSALITEPHPEWIKRVEPVTSPTDH